MEVQFEVNKSPTPRKNWQLPRGRNYRIDQTPLQLPTEGVLAEKETNLNGQEWTRHSRLAGRNLHKQGDFGYLLSGAVEFTAPLWAL